MTAKMGTATIQLCWQGGVKGAIATTGFHFLNVTYPSSPFAQELSFPPQFSRAL